MAEKRPILKRFLGAIGWILLLILTTTAVWRIFIYPSASNWGSTKEERLRSLPGDELGTLAGPKHTTAISIHASAEEVWKWLVQIGQDRGGFYSYTFLENLVGAGIRNTNEVRPEWQELKVGDVVRLGRDEGVIKLGVLAIEPGRYLILPYWGAFVLEPSADGQSTRMLVRSRSERKPLPRFILSLTLDPIHFLMQRRMLLGIKELAEARTPAERPLIPTTSDYLWFFSILGCGLMIPVILFARRWKGRLLTAIGLSALLILVLYGFPPVPAYGLALAIFTLLILVWRVAIFRPDRPPATIPESR